MKRTFLTSQFSSLLYVLHHTRRDLLTKMRYYTKMYFYPIPSLLQCRLRCKWLFIEFSSWSMEMFILFFCTPSPSMTLYLKASDLGGGVWPGGPLTISLAHIHHQWHLVNREIAYLRLNRICDFSKYMFSLSHNGGNYVNGYVCNFSSKGLQKFVRFP